MLTYEKVDLDKLAIYFKLDLSRVSVTVLDLDTRFMRIVRRSKIPIGLKNFFYDQRNVHYIKKYKFDVFINHCYHSNLPSLGKFGVYVCMFPQKLESTNKKPSNALKAFYRRILRQLYLSFIHRGFTESVQSYDEIVSISEFTTTYIKEYWGTTSELLYPICEDMADKNSSEKKKIILNTGRFFERIIGNHHKRQDAMLEAFSTMKDLHKNGWELHFVGSVAEDAGALRYILGLLKKAEGLPVHFHFNADFPDVKRLFNEASMYWHATGYGISKAKHPEMQEHFGITTVESMSTGCVPIVYEGGGQKDILTRSGGGYAWNTLEELEALTSAFVNLPESKKQQLVALNIKGAKLYDKAHFVERVADIFKDLV